jgi:hypothetical protein
MEALGISTPLCTRACPRDAGDKEWTFAAEQMARRFRIGVEFY